MNMVIPNEGKLKILDEAFRLTTTRESFLLDLFKSNTTVADGSTATDFTISDFLGYLQVVIARGDWNAAVIVANVGVLELSSVPDFICTDPTMQQAYGWILRGASSGIVYAGQNFDSPRCMATGAEELLNPFKIRDKTYA